jgi:hypothetical protein
VFFTKPLMITVLAKDAMLSRTKRKKVKIFLMMAGLKWKIQAFKKMLLLSKKSEC